MQLGSMHLLMELPGNGQHIVHKCGSDWNVSHLANMWRISSRLSGGGCVFWWWWFGGGVIPGMLRVKVHRSDYRKETTGKKTLRGNRHQTDVWFLASGNSVKCISSISFLFCYMTVVLLSFLFLLLFKLLWFLLVQLFFCINYITLLLYYFIYYLLYSLKYI